MSNGKYALRPHRPARVEERKLVSEGIAGIVAVGEQYKGAHLLAEYSGQNHVTLRLAMEDNPRAAYYNLRPKSIEFTGLSYLEHNLQGKGVNPREYSKDLANLGLWLDAIKKQEANGIRR